MQMKTASVKLAVISSMHPVSRNGCKFKIDVHCVHQRLPQPVTTSQPQMLDPPGLNPRMGVPTQDLGPVVFGLIRPDPDSSLTACDWQLTNAKLTGFQLIKKFPTFYETQGFIAAFTSARHMSLSCASSIQPIPHILKIHSNFIFHLCLSLPSGFFPTGFPPKNSRQRLEPANSSSSQQHWPAAGNSSNGLQEQLTVWASSNG